MTAKAVRLRRNGSTASSSAPVHFGVVGLPGVQRHHRDHNYAGRNQGFSWQRVLQNSNSIPNTTWLILHCNCKWQSLPQQVCANCCCCYCRCCPALQVPCSHGPLQGPRPAPVGAAAAGSSCVRPPGSDRDLYRCCCKCTRSIRFPSGLFMSMPCCYITTAAFALEYDTTCVQDRALLLPWPALQLLLVASRQATAAYHHLPQ